MFETVVVVVPDSLVRLSCRCVIDVLELKDLKTDRFSTACFIPASLVAMLPCFLTLGKPFQESSAKICLMFLTRP
jgi:hypothetical protein